ncbi:MAG: hypothetical protein Q8S55_19090 [Methylococcaceae bacterium]|nr:hypothetical protein [Methylococcaceae bacterium]
MSYPHGALVDAAYDAPQIHAVSRQLGHIPLIDVNPRRDAALKAELASKKESLPTARAYHCRSNTLQRAKYC